eukprot:c22411_g1_i1 orf=704-1804(+)
MSVHAQYPSNVLSEFRKRARPEMPDGVQDSSMQENLLHLYSAGVNFLPQPALNTGAAAENVLSRNMVSSRKKPREEEAAMAKQHIMYTPFTSEAERCSSFMVPVCSDGSNFAVPVMNPQQSTWPLSFGMPSNYEDTVRLGPAATSTGGMAANVNPSLRPILDYSNLQLHCSQQEVEIDQIIKIYGQQLKQALEEKRQQHTRALLDLIERCVLSRVRERAVEIENVCRRNAELENCVRKLSLESQVWMNVAQSHEALVTSLRSNLEQVVAQSKEQSKGNFGQSDVEDAESCVHGASTAADDDLHTQTAKEIRDLKEQRSCKFCRKNSISVLLLPCRHLCLCVDCDLHLSTCPICGASKSASLQVYME